LVVVVVGVFLVWVWFSGFVGRGAETLRYLRLYFYRRIAYDRKTVTAKRGL